MGKLSLTGRLLILTLIALVPALLVLSFNIVSTRSNAYREVHAAALSSGRLASMEMIRIIAANRGMLEVLAQVPSLRSDDVAECNAFLEKVDTELDPIVNLMVLRSDGTLKCSSKGASAGQFDDRWYFTEVMKTRTFVVGGFVVDRITGKQALPLVLPAAQGGQIDDVIVALLDLHWLGERVKERGFSQGNALTIADRNGIILAREPFPEKFVGTQIPSAFLPLVHAPSPGTMEVTSQDGTRRIIGYYPGEYGIYVSAGLSVDHEMQAIRAATLNGVAVVALAIIGPFIAVWLAGHVLVRRPAIQLVRTIAAWRGGDENARTGMRGDSEFAMVGAAIDDFMDELAAGRAQHDKDRRQRELLVRELDHRIKNLLSTVQAVARQTFKSGRPIDEISETFTQRIRAMAGAHQLLTNNWQSAPLCATVNTAVAPFSDGGGRRFDIEGENFDINAAAALSLSMALHELCTNAAKYGALSVEAGRVRIRWVSENGDGRFLFTWQEVDGPPVGRPEREGFGTLMIERVLSEQLGGSVIVDYLPAGVVCTIHAATASVRTGVEPQDGPAHG